MAASSLQTSLPAGDAPGDNQKKKRRWSLSRTTSKEKLVDKKLLPKSRSRNSRIFSDLTASWSEPILAEAVVTEFESEPVRELTVLEEQDLKENEKKLLQALHTKILRPLGLGHWAEQVKVASDIPAPTGRWRKGLSKFCPLPNSCIHPEESSAVPSIILSRSALAGVAPAAGHLLYEIAHAGAGYHGTPMHDQVLVTFLGQLSALVIDQQRQIESLKARLGHRPLQTQTSNDSPSSDKIQLPPSTQLALHSPSTRLPYTSLPRLHSGDELDIGSNDFNSVFVSSEVSAATEALAVSSTNSVRAVSPRFTRSTTQLPMPLRGSPLNALPAVLLSEIFTHVAGVEGTLQFDPNALNLLACVCKRWYSIALFSVNRKCAALDFSQSTWLTDKTLAEAVVLSIPPSASALRRGAVKMQDCSSFGEISALPVPMHLLSNASRLRALNLSNCYGITDAALGVLSTYCADTLEVLVVSGCRGLTHEGWLQLPGVKYLAAAYCPQATTNRGLLNIAMSPAGARLKTLDLSGADVTDAGLVHALSSKCLELQYLLVARCSHITAKGIEAVTKALPMLQVLTGAMPDHAWPELNWTTGIEF